MKTYVITFDQPLNIQARDICEWIILDEVHMVVRLRGYHLILSYMGCLGQIMAGSGIKDILSIIYAEGSIEKMLSGPWPCSSSPYHFAAVIIAVNIWWFEKRKRWTPATFWERRFAMLHDEYWRNSFKSNKKTERYFWTKIWNCKRGKTCKLWILYFRMVSLLNNFLAAERMRYWELHLDCIELTLPLFHAVRHFNYTKSARLYL